jgi:hypothetical protein
VHSYFLMMLASMAKFVMGAAILYSGGQRGMTRIGPSHPERTESS